MAPPLLTMASWAPFPGTLFENGNGTIGDGDGDPGELPSNWSSLIGIVTAIVGNMLIALALNVQRYAHIRLHQQRQRNRERARQALKSVERQHGESPPNGRVSSQNGRASGVGYGTVGRGDDEAVSRTNGRPSRNSLHRRKSLDKQTSRGSSTTTTPRRRYHDDPADDSDYGFDGSGGGYDFYDDNSSGLHVDDIDDINDDPPSPSDPLAASFSSGLSAGREDGGTSYLRSPYWWLGQVLITVGEMGNFLAYGFAPASIVSPLGVVALISNCVIAPILFKERFRMRDFGGVVIAIAGAVTVVLSAKHEETKLAPHDVWAAITTPAFLVYVLVTCSLIALLTWASPRYGNRTILIDLGLVGLYGAYTVLATKGVSSMLSSTLFGAFTTPVTYVLLFILLATAVMQVRYVNKALQRFDSTQVIPIQFVMFTINVIVGSAVLYRDFERTSAQQAAKFVGGCLLTFSGVIVITSGRPPADDGDDEEEDLDLSAPAAGGRISLAEQARLLDEPTTITATTTTTTTTAVPGSPRPPRTPRASYTPSSTGPPTPRSSLTPSRRSSRASHVGFAHLRGQQLSAALTQGGVPSPRSPLPPGYTAAAPSSSHIPQISSTPVDDAGDDGDDEDDEYTPGSGGADTDLASPLLENPWKSSGGRGGGVRMSTSLSGPGILGDAGIAGTSPSKPSHLTVRPGLGPSAFSADTVLLPVTLRDRDRERERERERARDWERDRDHFQSLFSPSPLLSSTVSTVVADTILKHMESGGAGGSVGGAGFEAGGGGGGSGGGGIGGSLHANQLHHHHSHHPSSSRRPSARRVRPGLRSSLFVPQDELEDRLERVERGEYYHHSGQGRHQQQLQQQPSLKSASAEVLVSASENPLPGAIGAVASDGHGDRHRPADSDGQGAAGQPGEAVPLQQPGGLRDRARSLSTTLGELLSWPRRTRRNTSPGETGRALGGGSGASTRSASQQNLLQPEPPVTGSAGQDVAVDSMPPRSQTQ